MMELEQDFILLLSAGTFILMMTTFRLVIKIAENGWDYMSSVYGEIYPFSNLKPAEDWRNSLMECGL